jgi:tryptophan halogenase
LKNGSYIKITGELAMMNTKVQKIVIVGGGTAGWMAAASLSKQFAGKAVSIQLIESDAIGTVGVGEATVPGITSYIQSLGIGELEFIKATEATFKLGIEFKNWLRQEHTFFHPFADYGAPLAGRDFYQCWLQLKLQGYAFDLEDFCLGTQLAKKNRFAQPDNDADTPLSIYNYAYHFDASLFAKFLRRYAEQRGVERIEGKIDAVKLDSDDGSICSVAVAGKGHYQGDFFIDCSGFRGLLIEENLKTGYEDWSEWLFCNRAVALQSRSVEDPAPFTRSTALAAGWQWTIPLQHRVGNGYVYCNSYISDDEAVATLKNRVPGEHLTEPKVIKFTAGVRKKFWNKNCVALGLASGFIEPLESTSISLIQTGIEKLLMFLPDLVIDSVKVEQANQFNQMEYERIRDFIILHYKASRRVDTKFWVDASNIVVPKMLQNKMETFERDGTIVSYDFESFRRASWLSMYNGFNITPLTSTAGFSQHDLTSLVDIFKKMRNAIQSGVNCAPTHKNFLEQIKLSGDLDKL